MEAPQEEMAQEIHALMLFDFGLPSPLINVDFGREKLS
jgi:hypothetical protein